MNTQTKPAKTLKTNRGALKTILLTILTCGLYSIIFYEKIGQDVNIVATRYDGKKTMNYALMFFIVGPLTLEIGTLAWFHKLSNRIGDELERRGIDYKFNAGTFWLWNTLGLLLLVGPFVYVHKIAKAMNLLNEDFNING